MRKNLLRMPDKVGEQVIHMSSTVRDVTKENMKVHWECVSFKAKFPKTNECLMEQVICKIHKIINEYKELENKAKRDQEFKNYECANDSK